MSNDSLGDRMKYLESRETERRFLPMLPICARIDGRGFSNFTRGLKRPYDEALSATMIDATKVLVDETHARIGYTQSDEISLVFLAEDRDSDIFFSGKVLKMASVLASLTATAFVRAMIKHFPHDWQTMLERLPHFDARVWQVPTKAEAANVFLWRNLDATKNATSMAARAFYSHSALHGKNREQMNEMLFAKGVNFDYYPEFFKRGTFVRRVTRQRTLTEAELARIPEKHRPPPDTLFTRSKVRTLSVPAFSKVVNRVEFIFDGAEPVLATEQMAT